MKTVTNARMHDCYELVMVLVEVKACSMLADVPANGERAGLYVRFITNMHHAGGLLWYNNSKLKLLNSLVVATARFSSNAK